MTHLTVTIAPHATGHTLFAPLGFSTPHGGATALEVTGGRVSHHHCAGTDQWCVAVTPEGGSIMLTYSVSDAAGAYPEAMFRPQPSRFTRAADGLVADAREAARGDDPAQAIATHVASLFSYGHPDTRFYDDHDELPQLCGLTEGSCVDINAYLIASLRAAGIEAGYVYGYFFPEEKAGTCEDGHCWVVTRENGATREWDIAHHIKMAAPEIRPALNPKPGRRVALAHSMGLTFPGLGLTDIKLMGEPMWLTPSGVEGAVLDIRLAPW